MNVNILDMSIITATRALLTRSYRFDALFFGRLEEFGKHGNEVLRRFSPRTAVERHNSSALKDIQEHFEKLKDNYEFLLVSDYEYTDSHLPFLRNPRKATTGRRPLNDDRIETLFSIEMLQPLLLKDLTDAEK